MIRACVLLASLLTLASESAAGVDSLNRRGSAWSDEEHACPGAPPRRALELARESGPTPVSVELDLEEGPDLTFLRWFGIEVDPVSHEIPIEIASETVGISIRADSRSSKYTFFVELIGPDGELLACQECPEAPAVGESKPGRATTQMPSTDRPGWKLTPGAYRFRVRATPIGGPVGPSPPYVDVTAAVRSDVAVRVDRLVDVNFVYLPGSTLSEEIATSAPEFDEFLKKIDEWMEPTGIRVGRVTHYDLERPEFSIVDGWEEAGYMFQSTSVEVGRPRALNAYCVEGFNWNPPLPVIGLSGGIPGPPYNGTRDSGIAMRMSPFFTCNDCIEAFAELFAHEIGHYLGFYHTTEANLEREDPLSDTPRCPPEQGDLGNCPDRYHIMFPLISPANTIWSPSQGRIAKTHPLVRTVAVVGGPRVGEEAFPPRRALVSTSPNPFREVVRLRLSAGEASGVPVSAAVYDLRGRRIRDLALGAEELLWDGRDAGGRRASAGVYFVRVVTTTAAENTRIVKLR